MPTEKKRVYVTPDPDALAVLGIDADRPEAVNAWVLSGLLRGYAVLVVQAGRELEAVLSRSEWNLLADLLNGNAEKDPSMSSGLDPLGVIVAEVEDGHRLDRLGEKWLLTKQDEKLPLVKARALADERAADLVSRLRALTPTHGEAILAAVRWFWAHHEEISLTKDEWWPVAFRTGQT